MLWEHECAAKLPCCDELYIRCHALNTWSLEFTERLTPGADCSGPSWNEPLLGLFQVLGFCCVQGSFFRKSNATSLANEKQLQFKWSGSGGAVVISAT